MRENPRRILTWRRKMARRSGGSTVFVVVTGIVGFWFPLSCNGGFEPFHTSSLVLNFAGPPSISLWRVSPVAYSPCFSLWLPEGPSSGMVLGGITNTLPALADYVWLSPYPRYDLVRFGPLLVFWLHLRFPTQPRWLWLPVMQ